MELGTAAASAAGMAAAKGAGGAALGGAVVGGLTLSTLVVMLLKQPRTSREWAVALISTLVCSLGLGACPASSGACAAICRKTCAVGSLDRKCFADY